MTVYSQDGGDTVAIDGKIMRGSRNGEKATHIVSAWCSANNLVLGQVKIDVKSNEITAIPDETACFKKSSKEGCGKK